MQNINPAFMRRAEAAKYLGISSRTLSDWQAKRVVPYAKVGRKVYLFRRTDLDAAMARFSVRAIGEG
jgi:excisionase family DNA binding protein